MDVVRQAIESLRGSIIIDSEPGVGTSMTIKLPLTLAIIDGLQVRTEEEIYVIPLTQVQECVELMNGHLREKDGSRLLDLRGEIVPYVNLREWFDIPGIRPALEQVIITTVDKKRVGIVVDDVVGEHQTVIKTLGRIYRDVEGISGATVLGDGSVSLILDIPDLIHSVTELSARSSS
jgi:two-component system chemotaxis sensor kinase CheA